MKTTLFKTILVIALVAFNFACGSGSTSSGNNTGAGTCATVPTDVTVDPASVACTTTAGKWTQYTVNKTAKTAFKQCDIEESTLYADQAAFDANEGTSSVAGITISSNSDFVKTATCASGSIVYTASGTTIDFLFVWEKQS